MMHLELPVLDARPEVHDFKMSAKDEFRAAETHALVASQARDRDEPLLAGEPRGGRRRVGHDEDKDDPPEGTDRANDDKSARGTRARGRGREIRASGAGRREVMSVLIPPAD